MVPVSSSSAIGITMPIFMCVALAALIRCSCSPLLRRMFFWSRKPVEEGLQAQVEPAPWLAVAENVGAFELNEAVEERPQRDRAAWRLGRSHNLSDQVDDQCPRFSFRFHQSRRRLVLPQKDVIPGRVRLSELKILVGDLAQCVSPRSRSCRLCKSGVKATKPLLRDGCLQMSAVRIVAVQRARRKAERVRQHPHRGRILVVLLDLLDGCQQDRCLP